MKNGRGKPSYFHQNNPGQTTAKPTLATRADRGRASGGTGLYLDATRSRSLGHLSGGTRRSPTGQARAGRREVLGLSPLSAPLPARRRGPTRPVPSRGSGGRGRARRGRGGAGGSGRGAGAAPRCCRRRSPRARARPPAPPPARARVPCACLRLRARGDARARAGRGRGKGSGGRGGAAPVPAGVFLPGKERNRKAAAGAGPGRALSPAPRRRSLIRSFGAETDVGSRHPHRPLKGPRRQRPPPPAQRPRPAGGAGVRLALAGPWVRCGPAGLGEAGRAWPGRVAVAQPMPFDTARAL